MESLEFGRDSWKWENVPSAWQRPHPFRRNNICLPCINRRVKQVAVNDTEISRNNFSSSWSVGGGIGSSSNSDSSTGNNNISSDHIDDCVDLSMLTLS